jgi:2-keto-4-pentenoate hydratase/2-oxohepta-3-ene-1,7-dioic acid hydratase in catechol pathway
MRLATFVDDSRAGRAAVGLVVGDRVLALAIGDPGLDSVRRIAAGGVAALRRVRAWADAQPDAAWRALDGVVLGPALPDPGAVYTVGLNYRSSGRPGDAEDEAPERPLIYGKAPTSVAGHGAVLAWDRALTANVDAECELGVVIGEATPPSGVAPGQAMRHVFGYTCIDDISSRDAWLDGDQWLLGKSMPGFCPVGPWVVTADEVDPSDLRLGCRINGVAIQDDTTARMRFPIAALVSYLSRHVVLRPGDLLATGTPDRLAGPLGPDRHLEPGDVVTCWIERIGELTTTIA